jgi:hypothetical protein
MEAPVGREPSRSLPVAPFEKLADGGVIFGEASVHSYADWIADLTDAPLKPTRARVLDVATKGRAAYVLVSPPVGLGVRPGAQKKTRRPHDRKQLTEAGREALARLTAGDAARGELWRGSQVWLLEYWCSGTALCDPVDRRKCAVRVVFSATIEQVSLQQVRMDVTGVTADGALSLHSRCIAWDPRKLRELALQEQGTARGELKRNSEDLLSLKAAVVKKQREIEPGAFARCAAACEHGDRCGVSPAPQSEDEDDEIPMSELRERVGEAAARRGEVDRLKEQVKAKEQSVRSARAGARRHHTPGERDRILELYSLGNLAASIQSLLLAEADDPPELGEHTA